MTVLRHPVSWLKSDFFYFINEQDHVNISLREFAALKSEALLLDGSGTPSLQLKMPTPYSLGASPRTAMLLNSSGVSGEVSAAYAAILAAVANQRNVSRDVEGREAALNASRSQGPGKNVADRRHGYFGRQRVAHLHMLRARASYYALLRARRLFTCADMLREAEGLLVELDLVGVTERFDETLLLAIDAGNLQALPPAHRVNVADARERNVAPEAERELRVQNRCSILLYERWRKRFNALADSQPPAFFARLAQMRTLLSLKKDRVVSKLGSINLMPVQQSAGVRARAVSPPTSEDGTSRPTTRYGRMIRDQTIRNQANRRGAAGAAWPRPGR